jgi:hypothetical protein
MTQAANLSKAHAHVAGSSTPINILDHFPIAMLVDRARMLRMDHFSAALQRGGQQDADEFLDSMLQLVTNAEPICREFFNSTQTIEMAGCSNCKQGASYRKESHFFARLQVGDRYSGTVTVQQLLNTQSSSAPQVLCETCRRKSDRTTKTTWSTTSQYFIISRTAGLNEDQTELDMREVQFDDKIQVSAADVDTGVDTGGLITPSRRTLQYKLLSEVVFIGEGSVSRGSSGHYYCIRHAQKEMILLNDSTTRRLQKRPTTGPDRGTVIAIYEQEDQLDDDDDDDED